MKGSVKGSVVIICIIIALLIGIVIYSIQSSSSEEFGWGRGRRWWGPRWRGRWWGPGRPNCYCSPYECNCGYSVGRRGWFW